MSINDTITTPCCCLIPKTLHLSFQQNESSKKAVKLFLAIIATSVIVFAALLAAGMVLTYFSAKIIKNNNGPFKIITIAISIFMSISAGLISFYGLDGAAFKKLNKMQNPLPKANQAQVNQPNLDGSQTTPVSLQKPPEGDVKIMKELRLVGSWKEMIKENQFEKFWDSLEKNKEISCLYISFSVGKFKIDSSGIITQHIPVRKYSSDIIGSCKHSPNCTNDIQHFDLLIKSTEIFDKDRIRGMCLQSISKAYETRAKIILSCFFVHIVNENNKNTKTSSVEVSEITDLAKKSPASQANKEFVIEEIKKCILNAQVCHTKSQERELVHWKGSYDKLNAEYEKRICDLKKSMINRIDRF